MDSASLFRAADATDAPLSPSMSPHASMLDHQGPEESAAQMLLPTGALTEENRKPATSSSSTSVPHIQQQLNENESHDLNQGHLERQQPLQGSLEDVSGNKNMYQQQHPSSAVNQTTWQQLQQQFPSYSILPPNAVMHAKRAKAPPLIATEPKRRRLCQFPNCDRVVKSQGHCQRHGAKPKRCKVPGCDKQAQGTHDGMCKRHWRDTTMPKSIEQQQPSDPSGTSVYDVILPQSIAYKPPPPNVFANADGPFPEGAIMPLIAHLRQGVVDKEFGWHRIEERKARGVASLRSLSTQFEAWERQLVLVEILLLSGGTPCANFRDLAHAWGRDKGFHTTLAQNVFERRGDIERKKRSDHGKKLTSAQKAGLRAKWKQRKSAKAATATYCQPVAHPNSHIVPQAVALPNQAVAPTSHINSPIQHNVLDQAQACEEATLNIVSEATSGNGQQTLNQEAKL